MIEEIINRNKNINRGFRKLEFWREALELFVYVKEKITSTKTISFKIKAQIEGSIFLFTQILLKDIHEGI